MTHAYVVVGDPNWDELQYLFGLYDEYADSIVRRARNIAYENAVTNAHILTNR